MKAIYINRATVNKKMHEETFSFYMLYLFAEESYYYSLMCQYIGLWQQREKWNKKLIIELIYFFKPETIKYSKEECYKFLNVANKVKTRKNKNQKELKMLNTFNSFINSQKRIVYIDLEEFLQEAWLWEWVDLFEQPIATLLGYNPSDSFMENQEDLLIYILQSEILETNDFLFINPYISEFFCEFRIEKESNLIDVSDAPQLYGMPLFSFPFCINLEKEKMKILRTCMQAKMKTISSMLEEFKETISREEFNRGIMEKCKLFYQKILPETAIMQKQIDNELYFQQFINSTEDYLIINMRLGVAPVSLLIDYYENASTLELFVAGTLKKNLALKTDISKCDVFLYYNFVLKNALD